MNPAAIKEVVALVRANETLPIVKSFHVYAGERKRLQAAQRRLDAKGTLTPSDQRGFYEREVKIYEAERRVPGIGACAIHPL
jgi:hypothetical protein